MKQVIALATVVILATAPTARAQDNTPKLFIEGLAGAVVPTFDIADVATTGGALGAAIGYRLSPRWVLIGEFDYGMHKDKATESVDINTTHLVGKLGYVLRPATAPGWEVILNLGAGVVNFDVDGAEGNSYFAINAGAKVAYTLNPSLALVLSPQGDIAFTRKSELSTSSAWVWPITTGLRISF